MRIPAVPASHAAGRLACEHGRVTDMASEAALAAVHAVAQRHGVGSDHPVVLRDFSNLIVHLAPHPVVARAATSTALLRPSVIDNLRRDLDVARFLADRGADVVRPLPDPLAGPHVTDGFVVTLWDFMDGATGTMLDANRFGHELRALHHTLADYRAATPGPATPFDDVRRFLDEPQRWWPTAPTDLMPMRRAFDSLARRIEGKDLPSQQLHGDAHAGNMLIGADVARWIDFEDTWRGPIEWDLACVAESRRLDPDRVFAAYGRVPDPEVLADFRLLRRLHVTAWIVVFASRFPSGRNDAARRIAQWET